jgi:hypothetical protein
MKYNKFSFLFVILFGFWVTMVAQDEKELLRYAMDGTIEAAVSSDALTAGIMKVGPGVTGTFPDYSSVSVDGSSLLFLNAGFNSITQEGAIDTQRYLGFSVTVDSGFRVDLSRLTFFTLRRTGGDSDHGLGAPSDYALWISVGGFEGVVASGVIPGNTSDEFTRIDIDVSHIDELQSIFGTVEFRFYLWSSEGLATPSQRELRIDDIILVGTDAEQDLIRITDGEWEFNGNLGWIYVFAEHPNWIFAASSSSWIYLPVNNEENSVENWFYAPN